MDKGKLNYAISNKDMLAKISEFKKLPRYVGGAHYTVSVFSDQKNLTYCATAKVLNPHQAEWSQELAGYDFKIMYPPRNKNGKPEMQSRHLEYHPNRPGIAE
jgi:hypothetical protein